MAVEAVVGSFTKITPIGTEAKLTAEQSSQTFPLPQRNSKAVTRLWCLVVTT